MGVKWYLMILICFSLMVSNIEHIFMGFLAIWVSSLEKSLFKFFDHFLKGFIYLFIYLFIKDEQGRGRERGRERIPSGLCTTGADVGFEPTNHEIMT